MTTHDPLFALLALAALLVGLVFWLIGSGMLFVKAFKASIWWGLGSLLLTMPVLYIFIGMYWKETRNGFWLHLLGIGLMAVGTYMALLMGVELNPLKRYTI
jgi:hypothetical protein